MRIDNINTNAMLQNIQQLNASTEAITKLSLADNITDTTVVTDNLIESIVGQIPNEIAYKANAKSIEVLNAVADSLINIKA
ncbi:hypothetical protein [Arcobacter sp. FWKO B]|uniref:hypothetical protein n=1 Tax=Arcobacter sp. FWKO B TaxID=2593672 RepID=UPI0018A5D866|nr:hypothetical protein [Arcobacter sp. FWKO B]QOG11750.1 hypothetical protein FWKOB_03100 [Arcobacter sp. FWKO B]